MAEKCKNKFSNFFQNGEYHKYRKQYESDTRYAHVRYLDPVTSSFRIFRNFKYILSIGHSYEMHRDMPCAFFCFRRKKK